MVKAEACVVVFYIKTGVSRVLPVGRAAAAWRFLQTPASFEEKLTVGWS